jgi:L,D-transpeptidase YnhG
VKDYPHFQLAQLVHGDLLASQVRPLKAFGDVPSSPSRSANTALEELREESLRRVMALRDRPVSGTIPSQFLTLSQKSRHAIAVDASRSRLYLFENSPGGLTWWPTTTFLLARQVLPKQLKVISAPHLACTTSPATWTLNHSRIFTVRVLCLSITPTSSIANVARPAVASGCTARHPHQFSQAAPGDRWLRGTGEPRSATHIIRTVAVKTTPVVIASAFELGLHRTARALRASRLKMHCMPGATPKRQAICSRC